MAQALDALVRAALVKGGLSAPPFETISVPGVESVGPSVGPSGGLSTGVSDPADVNAAVSGGNLSDAIKTYVQAMQAQNTLNPTGVTAPSDFFTRSTPTSFSIADLVSVLGPSAFLQYFPFKFPGGVPSQDFLSAFMSGYEIDPRNYPAADVFKDVSAYRQGSANLAASRMDQPSEGGFTPTFPASTLGPGDTYAPLPGLAPVALSRIPVGPFGGTGQ